MRVSERWSQRSLRSFRMVCADTSKRRARSSTVTRPKARAMLRISDWRCDSPATATPQSANKRLMVPISRQGSTDQVAEARILVKASVRGLQPALGEELPHDTLGLAGAAKQPSFQRIELVARREKSKSSLVAHHDAGGLRTDFDDVAV